MTKRTRPSHLVERAELERILALAIERMSKLERTILNLYYYEELNLSQISKIVGLHLSPRGPVARSGHPEAAQSSAKSVVGGRKDKSMTPS